MRMTLNRARVKVMAICPNAREVGFGPVGYLTWHVFDRETKELLGRGKTEKGAWCRALEKLTRRTEFVACGVEFSIDGATYICNVQRGHGGSGHMHVSDRYAPPGREGDAG